MKLLAVAAAALAIPAAADMARAQTPQVDAAPNAFLMRRLALAPALERYLHLMRSNFTRLDADANGRLDDADLPLHAARSTARYSNIEAARVMAADANGDGAVTEAELREKLTHDLRQIAHLERRPRPDVDTLQERVEKQVRRSMAADANRDGRVTRQEAVEFAERQSAYTHGNQFGVLTEMRQALTVAPAGKSALTWPQLEAAATAFFHSADTDHNGTISSGEFQAVRERLKRAERQEAERRAAQNVRADCALPKPSAAAKMLLLGTSETEALSSVALATQDMITNVGSVVVEPGKAPLYIVLTSMQPTIWRIFGDTGRVERVVVSDLRIRMSKTESDPTPLVGVVGLPAARVSIPPRVDCLQAFSEAPSIGSAKVVGAVVAATGRRPDMVAAHYRLHSFNVPSGRIEAAPRRSLFTPQPVDLKSKLAYSYPGGIVTVDAKTVVARVKVEPYEVLPQEAGLAQLLKSGALTQAGPREFTINRKMRLPAVLSGYHSVRFVLKRGVPAPDGDPGYSKIISEETGQPLPRP